jgi:hypothetical protein
MTTLHPDLHSAALVALAEAAAKVRDEQASGDRARAYRDRAIVQAHREYGLGIREIGRATGIDPTHVSRIVRRGRA